MLNVRLISGRSSFSGDVSRIAHGLRGRGRHKPAPNRLKTIMKKLQLTSTIATSASNRRIWGGIVSFFMISTRASEKANIVNKTIDPVSFNKVHLGCAGCGVRC